MTLVDRFICRREGHVSAMTLKKNPYLVSARARCTRCGEWFELPLPELNGPGRNTPKVSRGQGQEGA